MSRRFKSFGSPLLSSDEPVEFEVYDTVFKCKPGVQGKKVLGFISATNDADYSVSADALVDFLTSCIVAEQRDEFTAMSESEDKIIPMETLTDIAAFLVEAYSGSTPDKEDGSSEGKSPSTLSEASSNGQTTTTSSSEDELLPQE